VSAWPAAEYQSPGATPDEYRFAGMGRRVVAWILDSILSGLVSVIAFVFALVSGAVGLNQQALDQVQRGAPDPFAGVTAPLLTVHSGPLVAAFVLLSLISAAYFAGSWLVIGGSPFQRILGLRLVDVTDGKNLTIDAAIIRWLLLYGIAGIFSGLIAVMTLNWIATTPTNQWLSTGAYGSTTTSFGGSGGLSNVVSLLSFLWSLALLISAGTNQLHRGIHDRLAGSIVVTRAEPQPTSWGYGAPTQAYQQPPQQPWGGIQPQNPGYPPQNPGYPPQNPTQQPWGGIQTPGPGYAPPNQGYPPQGGQSTPPPPSGPTGQ
jgi:hypothetical protein